MPKYAIDASINARGVNAGARKVKTQLDRLTRAADKLRAILSRAFAIFSSIYVAQGIASLLDSFTLISNRLQLVTTGTKNLNAVLKELYVTSQRTRTDFVALSRLYSRIAINADNLGLSQKQLLKITESVGKSVRVTGATPNEAKSGLLQLSQALGSGYLRGDELRSIIENLPRLARSLADYLNVPFGQLKILGEQGKLTADIVVKAIQKSMAQVDIEFKKLTPTVGESYTVFVNSITLLLGTVNKVTGAIGGLASGIIGFATVLGAIAPIIATILGLLTAIISARIALGLWRLGNRLYNTTIAFAPLAASLYASNALFTSFAAIGLKKVTGLLGQISGAIKYLTFGMINLSNVTPIKLFATTVVAALVLFSDRLGLTSEAVISFEDIFTLAFSDLANSIQSPTNIILGFLDSILEKSKELIRTAPSISNFLALYAVIPHVLSGDTKALAGVLLPSVVDDTNRAKNAAKIAAKTRTGLSTVIKDFDFLTIEKNKLQKSIYDLDTTGTGYIRPNTFVGQSTFSIYLSGQKTDLDLLNDRYDIISKLIRLNKLNPGTQQHEFNNLLESITRENSDNNLKEYIKQLIKENKRQNRLRRYMKNMLPFGGDSLGPHAKSREQFFKDIRTYNKFKEDLRKSRPGYIPLFGGDSLGPHAKSREQFFEDIRIYNKFKEDLRKSRPGYIPLFGGDSLGPHAKSREQFFEDIRIYNKFKEDLRKSRPGYIPLFGGDSLGPHAKSREQFFEDIRIYNKFKEDLRKSRPGYIPLFGGDSLGPHAKSREQFFEDIRTYNKFKEDLRKSKPGYIPLFGGDSLGPHAKSREQFFEDIRIYNKFKEDLRKSRPGYIPLFGGDSLGPHAKSREQFFEDIRTYNKFKEDLRKSRPGYIPLFGGDSLGPHAPRPENTFSETFSAQFQELLGLISKGKRVLIDFKNSSAIIFADIGANIVNNFANSMGQAIAFSENLGSALENVARTAIAELISGFIKLGIQWVLQNTIFKAVNSAIAAASVAEAAVVAVAWAPAAAAATLALAGTNAAPAAVALATTHAISAGLSATAFAAKGINYVRGPGTSLSDNIPAMLSVGEAIITAAANRRNPGIAAALNSGQVVSPTTSTQFTTANNRNIQTSVSQRAQDIKIVVENHTDATIRVDRLSETDIRIIARQEISAITPNLVATGINRPNSNISKAITNSMNTNRRKL